MASLLKSSSLNIFETLQKKWKKLFEDRTDRDIESYESTLQSEPKNIKVLTKLAPLFYKKGRFEEAVECLLKVADEQEKENFTLKAIDTCKSILRIDPQRTDINLRMIELFNKVGMKAEAAGQYRIAINALARAGEKEKSLELAERLVQSDPSPENRAKLAEIYHHYGLREEAVKQYEFLAREARHQKNFPKLMHYYELILPQRPSNLAILKDLCILYLRDKNPERTLQLIDHYKASHDASFAELAVKAKQMVDALKRQKKV